MGEMNLDKPQSSPERTPAVTQVRSFPWEAVNATPKERTSVIKTKPTQAAY